MSQGGERCGNGAPGAGQGGTETANESEPLMKCRKRIDGIETRVQSLPWDEPDGSLPTGQVVPGTKAARARFRRQPRTWEPPAPMGPAACWSGRRKGAPQAAGTARGGVPVRGRGADRPVVAVMPGNAGGAKGAGCLGLLGGNRAGRGGAR